MEFSQSVNYPPFYFHAQRMRRDIEAKRQAQAMQSEWDDGYEAGLYDCRCGRSYNDEMCEDLGENWASGYAAGHANGEL